MEGQLLVRRLRALAVLLATFAVSACSGLQVYTAKSPTAAFATYRTYAHGGPEPTPPGFASTALTPVVWELVQGDIDRELASKGYVRAASGTEPDVFVRSGSGSRTREHEETAPVHINTAWVGSEETERYTQATLVIDVFDRRSRALVWHGSSLRVLDAPAPSTVSEASVADAVRAILRTFPWMADRSPR